MNIFEKKELYEHLINAYIEYKKLDSDIPKICYFGKNPTSQRDIRNIREMKTKLLKKQNYLKDFIYEKYEYEFDAVKGFKKIRGTEYLEFSESSFRKKLNKLFFSFWGKI